jgi:hypothetical protein
VKLEIGNSYLSKIGEIVKIASEDIPNEKGRVFIDTIGRSYLEDGTYYYGDNNYSLTSIIVSNPGG